MSNNGKNTNDELQRDHRSVHRLGIVNRQRWDAVPPQITSGVTYEVGIDENSANSVLYDSGTRQRTTLTDLNGNSMSWNTSKAWELGFFGSANASEQSSFLPQRRPTVRMGTDLRLNRRTNSDRSSTPSNDNDGASCGNTGLEAKRSSSRRWRNEWCSGAPNDQVVMRRVM